MLRPSLLGAGDARRSFDAGRLYGRCHWRLEQRRRGQIAGTEQRGNATVITAMVPLANMFGYVNNLRSMSQGRAQYSMYFDHYEQVPQAVSDEVRSKLAG